MRRPVAAALASATSVTARACVPEHWTGRPAVGLDADLRLLDGDPLTDITSLQRALTVVSRAGWSRTRAPRSDGADR